MARRMTIALVLAVLAWIGAPRPADAIEIATGKMLGPGYDQRAFYVREEPDSPWRKTYSEPDYRPEAQGRLMNLRIAQAFFHDEWLTEVPFDPAAHTERLIEALDVYKAHGILAINASLQGGNAGYNKEVPSIARVSAAKAGPGKGMLNSAFLPDGSLKPAWMARVKTLQRALDRRGMILNLTYFYFGQDEVLTDVRAIHQAVKNATDWLIDNDCRNVIIEVANEFDYDGWDHDRYIDREIGHLIRLTRERFAVKHAAFRLPISASTGGSMLLFPGVQQEADFVTIHGNGRKVDDKGVRTRELYDNPNAPGPIYMNEDDSGRRTTPEVLVRELASCDAVFHAGGSWGYMPWRQVQMFPFPHLRPGASAVVRTDMPESERDAAYFKAVLEHIQRLVRRPAAAATAPDSR
jgi:hypothetical protein